MNVKNLIGKIVRECVIDVLLVLDQNEMQI